MNCRRTASVGHGMTAARAPPGLKKREKGASRLRPKNGMPFRNQPTRSDYHGRDKASSGEQIHPSPQPGHGQGFPRRPPKADKFDFQLVRGGKRSNIFHGTLEDFWPAVEKLNTSTHGADVFVLPNGVADRQPRTFFAAANNNEQINSALAAITAYDAKPNMTVEDGGRLRLCYPCSDIPPDQYATSQKRLNAALGVDVTSTNLSRVPLPGTLHFDNPAKPRLVELRRNDAGKNWTFDDLIGRLDSQSKPFPSSAIPKNIADTLALRLRLLENGFDPVIVSGKIPVMNGWQLLPLTAESLREWTYKHSSATNTGNRAKNAPALDIDIMHPEAAEAVEALARQHFAERGNIYVRIGLPPKRLIPLRTDAPFKKLARAFAAPVGADGKPPKIEILGDGQQYVVAGIHPDTYKPYRWTNGANGMDTRDIRHDALPSVTVEDCEAFLADAVKLLVEQFGFVEKQVTAGGGATTGRARAAVDRIARAFRVIPNDDVDWDNWCVKGMACYRATDGSEAGYKIWCEWSAKSQKHNEQTTFTKWHSKFENCPPHSVNAGSIFFWANEIDPNWDERYTDLGNARRLVRLHGDNIRYVAAWKSWLVWRDGHWRRDDDGEIMRLAKATVEGMYAEAAGIADEEIRKALRKHALKCQSAQRLAAMVELAKTERAVVLPIRTIDADPLLLGVENGVIDLRTGLFRPTEREDYVTKRCGVAFDPSARCPNWVAFLSRIFVNDRGLIAYVQRACGYTLTGLTDEEVMYILWNTGSNGKSTLRETIFALMGDYAMGADASLLVAQKKQQGGATPDIARMHGKRLVTVNETAEGDHLNESRVKFITSHDTTTARFLYENPFDFTPTHKTWLTTNKKPIIKGTDPGIWRRVQMWPFLFPIPEEERDRYFRQKWLMPELPSILNWALAGLMDYHKQGLAPPLAVTEATEEYRKDMDVLGQWIAARLVSSPETTLKRTDLFRDYEVWSKANVGWHMTSIAFGRELAARKETLGLTEVWLDRERGWRGVALCSPTALLFFPV
jgi:putative DNA primase/helicase